MELCDRLVRFGAPHLQAAFAASGPHLVADESEEITDDLASGITEVGTWMCARLYGQHAAKNRVARVTAVATGQTAQ